jgi:hypothetical protein
MIPSNGQDDAWLAKVEAFRLAEKPLVDALASVGIRVESVWDLVNTASRYPAAIRVLLDHIARPYPDAIREGIARALATPDARPHWDDLLKLYRKEEGRRAQHGLAVAIAALSSRDNSDVLLELIKENRFGESRVFFVRPLHRFGDSRSDFVLLGLRSDPDLGREIDRVLRPSRRNRKR